MKFFSFGFCTLVAAISMGCATTTFTKTGNYNAPERSSNCDLAIYTTPPSNPFKELGLIRFYTGPGNSVYTLDGVKSTAREYVCKAGGNGIIVPEPTELIYPQVTVILTE